MYITARANENECLDSEAIVSEFIGEHALIMAHKDIIRN